MIEVLTSDTGILVASFLGLALTTISIVRDTRTQRDELVRDEVPVRVELARTEDLAA